MKKVIICLVCIGALLGINVLANSYEEIKAFITDFEIYINDQKMNFTEDVVLIGNRTYIPLRAVCEQLGNTVVWDDKTKTISIDNQDNFKLYPFKAGSLYGYADKFGNVVIEPQFEYAGEFSEGLACVGKTETASQPFMRGDVGTNSYVVYGYINTTGELVIPYSNGRERDFHEGFACMWDLTDRECWFIDRSGNKMFEKIYYDMKDFSNGFAAVLINDTAENPTRPAKETQQWKFIDADGNESRETYDKVTSFEGGLSIVEQNGVQRVINTSFETVFQSQYTLLTYNGNGKYIAKNEDVGKYGVIDSDENVIIDFAYDYIYYSDHMYKVMYRNNSATALFGMINEEGETILEPSAKNFALDYTAGMSVLNKNVIDRRGNIILKTDEYTSVSPIAETLIYVRKQENDKMYEGYIDRYGNEIVMNEVNYDME